MKDRLNSNYILKKMKSKNFVYPQLFGRFPETGYVYSVNDLDKEFKNPNTFVHELSSIGLRKYSWKYQILKQFIWCPRIFNQLKIG